ncbi:MAG: hypothetical protein UT24_C0003G0076 [Candidatus Woesebacteria bacterium GW2011_GWB1_39_12]|uniref:Uncharacterized protein n=1 Tax=Candidatus Woesebacteria bacterium GW2011_GWB1_39_12 TaxID=1618574 RepID=A0A0G0MCA6_9BACT|nr:MAG: hypothetical protein UT24_C0003G0076 [Candidatus Woesebacteria bacterium GW2011_GWB1_39_12]
MKILHLITGVLCGVLITGFAHEPSHALFAYYLGLTITEYLPLQAVYTIGVNIPNYAIALTAAAPYLLSMSVGLLSVIFNRKSLFWRGFSIPLIFQQLPKFFIPELEPVRGFQISNGDWLTIQYAGTLYALAYIITCVGFSASWLILTLRNKR